MLDIVSGLSCCLSAYGFLYPLPVNPFVGPLGSYDDDGISFRHQWRLDAGLRKFSKRKRNLGEDLERQFEVSKGSK